MRISKANNGPARSRSRHAFSLIELVTALVISSIIITALGSAVVVASAALPNDRTRATADMEDALQWMALEISEAEQIKASGNAVLTIVVPDRDGDGQTELISFTWDGKAGSPLLRSLNKAAPEVVAAGVDAFSTTTERVSYSLGLSRTLSRERVASITVSVMPSGTQRTLTRTIVLPNEPQVLDVWVRADFDHRIDPTTIDRDWSGSTDLYTNGTLKADSIDHGWWRAGADLSVRNPGKIDVPLTASARIQIQNIGDYATIYAMVDPVGLSAAGLRLKIQARSSATRLTLEGLTTLAWVSLWSTDVSAGPLDVTLVVLPASSRAIIVVNGDEIRSVGYSKTAFGTSGAVVFDRSGSDVYFDWIDVRIGGSP